MSRIKRLVRPESQGSDWKAAIPVMALASLTLAACTTMAPPPGGHLVAEPDVRAMADFKSCAKPKWPEEAFKKEQTGTVTLGFEISDTGKVLNSQVIKSSGHVSLDEAARTGIEVCTFIPGQHNGKAVRSPMKMQYVWLLK